MILVVLVWLVLKEKRYFFICKVACIHQCALYYWTHCLNYVWQIPTAAICVTRVKGWRIWIQTTYKYGRQVFFFTTNFERNSEQEPKFSVLNCSPSALICSHGLNLNVSQRKSYHGNLILWMFYAVRCLYICELSHWLHGHLVHVSCNLQLNICQLILKDCFL